MQQSISLSSTKRILFIFLLSGLFSFSTLFVDAQNRSFKKASNTSKAKMINSVDQSFQMSRDQFQTYLGIKEFTKFVFQPYFENVEDGSSKLMLMCYVVDSRGEAFDKFEVPVLNSSYRLKGKVVLGNIELHRDTLYELLHIKDATDRLPEFDNFYFTHAIQEDHLTYMVTLDGRIPDTGKITLMNPSPPAKPGFNLKLKSKSKK